MQGNVVQKTKFYFIILAAIMTLSLTYVMFKWGTSSKVYKITSHETHVHIQQLPAMDKPFKLPAVRHLELQLTTTLKPGPKVKPGPESKTRLESKLGPDSKNQTNQTVDNKTGKLTIHTSKNLKEAITASSTTASSSSSSSPSTTEIFTTKRHPADTYNATNSIKDLHEKNDENPKISKNKKEIVKTGIIMQENDKKENEANLEILKDISNVHDKNQNVNQAKTNTNAQRESKKTEFTKPTSAVQIDHMKTDDKAMKDKTKFSDTSRNQKTVDIVEKTLDQSKGSQIDSKVVEKIDRTYKTEISKATSIGMDKKIENSEKEKNMEKNEKEQILYGSSDTDLNKTNTNLQETSSVLPTFEIAALNESFIEEKLLLNENSPSVGDQKNYQRKTDNQESTQNDREIEKDQKFNSYLKKGTKVTKDDAEILNNDKLQFEKSKVKPIATTTKATAMTSKINISDDFSYRRRMVEERLKLIKEQLINRTIISDGRKVSSKERFKNIKADSLQENTENNQVNRNDGLKERNEAGPINRYLQQRLRHLGLRNKMNPMFANTNDNNANIDAMLKHEGKTSRPDTCKSCFKMDFRKIINEANTCKGTVPDILILISTSPQNKDARDAIRTSWCKSCKEDNSKIKYLFVLGNASNDNVNDELKVESDNNHDIIQIDFKDSYANLTYKTITGVRWANEYCENAKYVMKTDDDMYVNTELLPLLMKQIPLENFLGGFCWGPSQPHRDVNSKWYVPYQSYKGSWFPSMCSGTGYILSSDIIPRILATSRNIPFFHLEDVYLAICLNKIGLHPTAIHGFNNEFTFYDRCDYKNTVLTSHRIEPGMMKYYWADSRLCDEQRPSNVTFSLREIF